MYLPAIESLWTSCPPAEDLNIASKNRAVFQHESENWWNSPSRQESIKGQAAVLIGITQETVPKIILTQRSGKLNSHAGEVSFPGGKVEEQDSNLFDTALREAHEEINLPRDSVTALGILPPMVSRWGLSVTPCVGLVDPAVKFTHDTLEVAYSFRTPVEWLLSGEGLSYDTFQGEESSYSPPRWNYHDKAQSRDFAIWGLTAMFLQNLLDASFQGKIKNKLDKLIQA